MLFTTACSVLVSGVISCSSLLFLVEIVYNLLDGDNSDAVFFGELLAVV